MKRVPGSPDEQMHHIPIWMEALAELDRVLVTGGYLIYSDFVFPTFLVGTAQVLLGGRMGFPTKNKIKTYLAERAYTSSYLASPGLNFVGIFQKPGRSNRMMKEGYK